MKEFSVEDLIKYNDRLLDNDIMNLFIEAQIENDYAAVLDGTTAEVFADNAEEVEEAA